MQNAKIHIYFGNNNILLLNSLNRYPNLRNTLPAISTSDKKEGRAIRLVLMVKT